MNTKALHKIGYGIYVVTSIKGDKLNGQIANTVFQITSQPPTIAVSINKENLTHQFIEESRVFAASVLRQATPLPFIGRFGFKSGRDIDKLDGVVGADVLTDEESMTYDYYHKVKRGKTPQTAPSYIAEKGGSE